MKNVCQICNNECKKILSDGRDFMLLDGKSDPFDIIFCEKCGIGYSEPFLTNSELMRYYPDNYEAYNPKKLIMAFLQTQKYKNDLKLIGKEILLKNASIFEIGAGRGELLAEAKKAGYIVEGLEPSCTGRRYAKDYFDIYLESEFASEFEYKKQYNIIIIRHVLEHVNEPYLILDRAINKGLKSGGIIFMKLPRLDSWEFRVFGRYCDYIDLPRHRVHYTRRGIIQLFRDLGCEKINVKSEIVPTSMMRSLKYYSRHGKSGFIKVGIRFFVLLPNIIQLIICQIICVIMAPFGAGRMVIIAQKK